MTNRLTLRELRAVEEALSARLAAGSEIDCDPEEAGFKIGDYETAWDKIADRLANRLVRGQK